MSSRNLHRAIQNREADENQKRWLSHSNSGGHKTGKRWKIYISFSLRSSWTKKFPLARHLNKIYCLALPIHVKGVTMVKGNMVQVTPWAEHQDALCASWLVLVNFPTHLCCFLLPVWLCMISITLIQKTKDHN